jgi:hypothetical protein
MYFSAWWWSSRTQTSSTDWLHYKRFVVLDGHINSSTKVDWKSQRLSDGFIVHFTYARFTKPSQIRGSFFGKTLLRSLRAREFLITFRTLITFSCTSKILIQVTDHFPFSIFQPFSLSCLLSAEEVLRFLRVQLRAIDSIFDLVFTRKYLTGRVLQYKKITNADGVKGSEERRRKDSENTAS